MCVQRLEYNLADRMLSSIEKLRGNQSGCIQLVGLVDVCDARRVTTHDEIQSKA